MKFFDKTWKLALSGAVVGLLVMLLAIYGNPANRAICVACFVRDTAGALKLHTAAPVQYFRPEIVGFVCGSFLLALLTMDAMQDNPGKDIRVLGDEAHTRKNIEKMLDYEKKSFETTVRPDGCFEITFQA